MVVPVKWRCCLYIRSVCWIDILVCIERCTCHSCTSNWIWFECSGRLNWYLCFVLHLGDRIRKSCCRVLCFHLFWPGSILVLDTSNLRWKRQKNIDPLHFVSSSICIVEQVCCHLFYQNYSNCLWLRCAQITLIFITGVSRTVLISYCILALTWLLLKW